MEKLKNFGKDGWHPNKGNSGSKESWRGDFKGINQVAGWMGKGKSGSSSEEQEHVSRPLHTLKDPSAFGPPPKNVNYHGGAAVPDRTTPDPRGLGAPLEPEHISVHKRTLQAAEEEARKPTPPPVPYRVNTTGLEAPDLPSPPRRITEQSSSPRGGSPSRVPARISTPPTASTPGAKPKPSLPPRLPPRKSPSSSVPNTPPPLPAHRPSSRSSSPHKPPPVPAPAPTTPSDPAQLNQGAINRLAAAGVSIPGLGIGSSNAQEPSAQSAINRPGTMSELHARFSKMNGGGAERAKAEGQSQGQNSAMGALGAIQKVAVKKPPPPAPPKKVGVGAGAGDQEVLAGQDQGVGGVPPPVPLASKPR